MLAREGPRQGKRTLGCPRVGRPPRTSSNVAETREEQQLGFGESWVGDTKSRDKIKGKLYLIDWMILNRPNPFIFIGRVGLFPQGKVLQLVIDSNEESYLNYTGRPVRLVP